MTDANENLPARTTESLVSRRQWGVLPTPSYWWGTTKAIRVVGLPFVAIAALVSGVWAWVGLPGGIAPAMGLVTSILFLGIVERYVRREVIRRRASASEDLDRID